MKNFFFHFPPFDSFVSGGNLYNQQFATLLLNREDVSKAANIRQADCIISDTIFLESPEVLAFLKNERIKKMMIIHHLKYFDDNKYLKEFDLLKQFDLLIANSEFTGISLLNNGIKESKITVVEPPVQSRKVPPTISSEFPIKAIMVGNWIDRKGYLELFTALEKTFNKGVPTTSTFKTLPITISIYGDKKLSPAYYKKCQQVIRESVILSKIICIEESISQPQMLARYAQYNLFLSASKMETYGMAVKEALNCGLYVLALNRGNLPYLLHNNNNNNCGKLFSSSDFLGNYLLHLSNEKVLFKNIVEKLNSSTSLSENNFKKQMEQLMCCIHGLWK